MEINRFEIWAANLNPRIGTESGKIRPVLILQTNLLNTIHLSTIICPITTNVIKNSDILRVHIKKDMAGLIKDSDIMIDQIRAIDNRRLVNKIGELPPNLWELVITNIKIVLDIE